MLQNSNSKSRHFVATSSGSLRKQNGSDVMNIDESHSITMRIVVSDNVSMQIRGQSGFGSSNQISPAASVCIRDHFSMSNHLIRSSKNVHRMTPKSFDIRSW